MVDGDRVVGDAGGSLLAVGDIAQASVKKCLQLWEDACVGLSPGVRLRTRTCFG